MALALSDTNEKSEVFNLVAPHAPTWNQFFTEYSIALGRKSVANVSKLRLLTETFLLSVPLIMVHKAFSVFKLNAKRLPAPIRRGLIRLTSQKIGVSTAKLSSYFEVNWVSRTVAIQEMAQWFKANRGQLKS